MIPAAMALLEDFGHVSGLRARGELTRYLGILVGQDANVGTIWEIVQAQLITRLGLTVQKTNNAMQRAQLARAVVLPKVIFVARHVWPTRKIVRQLQILVRDFVWKARLSTTPGARGWLPQGIAQLPEKFGSLAIPDIGNSLKAMAAATVARYAHKPIPTQPISQRSQSPRYVQPSRSACNTASWQPTLTATGETVIAHLNAISRTQSEIDAYAPAYRAIRQESGRNCGWRDGGVYEMRLTTSLPLVQALLRDHHGGL
ncbi:TPA: hypothetical protein N0F65_007847 [Lagenidium giganteum]|uniref:Uncharacterized protein n=1 Tax=Lagenidium giganteum TaxID=4803 RepID=A0AAV2YLA0_9STRA|nr:TPA: hypothetical protein N0F65_007847 [Lagenidium giganteum]